MKPETRSFAVASIIAIVVLGAVALWWYSGTALALIFFLGGLAILLLRHSSQDLFLYLLIVFIGPVIELARLVGGAEIEGGLLAIPLWVPLFGGFLTLYLRSFLDIA